MTRYLYSACQVALGVSAIFAMEALGFKFHFGSFILSLAMFKAFEAMDQVTGLKS